MDNIVGLLLVWFIGLALGCFFFVGLWWTVQKSMRSVHPASWFLISMLVRMAVTITGFYSVVIYVGTNEVGINDVGTSEMVNASWLRLLFCLLGFICARFIISNVISRRASRLDKPVKPEIATEQYNSPEGSQHAP
tara:strand:+ start:31403 stop:31810 length:408 start_codon:yes stop_codon:yes gene_type:complete